jgi:ribosomal protein S18 acetylase RimI-like enzyme
MPEIEIRPAIDTDIPKLIALDHNYTTDTVWQMDIQQDDGQIGVSFRQTRLPRSARVEYPRAAASLADDWTERSGLLVAVLAEDIVGYISLRQDIAPITSWATDLVVMRRVRRQGIGSALVLAAQDWTKQHDSYRMVLEMQPKNYPAICLAIKLGFDFCGYNDRYYANHDIALFFAKPLH